MENQIVISNGVDIVKTSRIEKIISSSKKEIFLKKVFNKEEIEYFEKVKYNPKSISGYFSAKEAVMKSLKKGIGKVKFKDITILKNKDNAPYISISKNAKKYMEELNITDFLLSISHEDEYAISFVIAIKNA